MKTYQYGGDGRGSRVGGRGPTPDEIKTCPACWLITDSYKQHCPRCFTNLDTREPWNEPANPPVGMPECYCTRCGTKNIGSNGVRVTNPPAGMGRLWCRDCVEEVQEGAPAKILVPQARATGGGAAPKLEPCKGCGSSIAASDVTCPHCGYTRWRFIIGLGIFSIAILAGAVLVLLTVEDRGVSFLFGWCGAILGGIGLFGMIALAEAGLKARKR